MSVLLSVAFALFAGLMMTRVFKMLHLRLPDVTAYLISGLIIGPFVLGRLGVPGLGFNSMEDISSLGVISNVALGFIAFDIGNEFRMSQLKKTGKAAMTIGIIQAVAATALVDIALVALHFVLGGDVLPLPVAITLGAIASATAPAATLMVVRQYKAKGPVTELLLPIVALDDAVGLVVFSVSLGIAQALQGGDLNVINIVVNPLLEILLSLVLGALMGQLLTWLEKIFFSNTNRVCLTIAFVMMTIALSSIVIPLGDFRISFSPLLVCMMLGTIFCNRSELSYDIMERSEKWTSPLYAVFFVISGAQLDLSVFMFPVIILIGVVYILVRCVGKYAGAHFSSKAVGCSKTVQKYLGITLFPQAGVALGMVVTAQVLGESMGGMIRNIALFAVLVYELVGPLLTKISLEKAGEIAPHAGDAANRARFKRQTQ